MAITPTFVDLASGGGSSTTPKDTAVGTVAVGDVILLALGNYNGGAATLVTPTTKAGGATTGAWTQQARFLSAAGDGIDRTFWTATVTAAGTLTVTQTPSAAWWYETTLGVRLQGATETGIAVGAGGTGTGNPQTSDTVSVPSAGAILVTVSCNASAVASLVGTNGTSVGVIGGNVEGMMVYKLAAAAGNDTNSWTETSDSIGFLSIAVPSAATVDNTSKPATLGQFDPDLLLQAWF